MNESMISYIPQNSSEEKAIGVENSNFFWGFPEFKEDDFDKEKKIIFSSNPA
jgi:hypothetical protein